MPGDVAYFNLSYEVWDRPISLHDFPLWESPDSHLPHSK